MTNNNSGIIRRDEAYSKAMVLHLLGISQKFWDKMLDDGLPYTNIGHSRWVVGSDLIQHFQKHSTTRAIEAE